MSEFRMPALGADMEAGTLVEWVKHPGDAVARGDIIAVVDTQKGAIEIEVFEDGVIDRTLVNVGEKVPVGTVLAVIRDGEAGAESPALKGPLTSEPAPPGPKGRPEAERDRVRASPAARRLAHERGVDLARIAGTGPGGAIQRADVERAAAAVTAPAPAPTPPSDRRAAMRAAIAAAMARSKREIPHYYLSTIIDMTAALTWLRAENERRSVADRLLPAALLLKSLARALREVPELNGFWRGGRFEPAPGVHVGWAIALRGGGLVAPAIHDADTMDLTALMRALQDLTTRARSGSLRSSELSDASVTATNLGDQGVDAAFGIIYPPQVALVGFGRIAERPHVVAGKIEVRSVMTATLSADHRASDGHRGGRLLAAIDRLLQEPDRL